MENLPIGAAVELDYSLLGVEASVRTNWLDVETGFLTGAAWAMAVESQRWQPQQLSVLLPPGWSVATSLPITPDGGVPPTTTSWWTAHWPSVICTHFISMWVVCPTAGCGKACSGRRHSRAGRSSYPDLCGHLRLAGC